MLRISIRRANAFPALLGCCAALAAAVAAPVDPAAAMASTTTNARTGDGDGMAGNNVERATNKGIEPPPGRPRAGMAGDTAAGGARPARDGDIAIREEFDIALQRNTIDALNLFIARHPGHPLAEMAAQKLRQLRRQKNEQ